MKRGLTVVSAVVLAVVPTTVSAAPPGAVGVSQTVMPARLVDEEPAFGTPHVMDGAVRSVVQVGDRIILGGTFTRAHNAGSALEVPRAGLLAFDVSTGQLDPDFDPSPNGTVEVVLPHPDGESVFVGGRYSSLGGERRDSLARVRVADGQVLPFDAGDIAGDVRDLRLIAGRLWVAGGFRSLGGHQQRALATVHPSSGARLAFMGLPFAGVHNGGGTKVVKIDADPAGTRLVALGNFTTVDGQPREQLVQLRVDGPSAQVSALRTQFYEGDCAPKFQSYVTDVSYAPDGRYFVVGTTGGYRGHRGSCDTTARFESRRAGSDVVPSWIDYTGGDTTLGVEVASDAVYVGGHQRWQNNPFARDAAGEGAVSRPGIAALETINGLPLTWNPTRDPRGVGVWDFLLTEDGLWVASDTSFIGPTNQLRRRIALMPPRPGYVVPQVSKPTFPNDVYSASDGILQRRSAAASSFGAPTEVPDSGVDWGAVRGAVMAAGRLYLAHADGTFTRRTFDGSTAGPPTPVDTADQIIPLAGWAEDIRTMTGLFLDKGRLYYTLEGRGRLFYRYFSVESDVVGAKRYVAARNLPRVRWQRVEGMFLAGKRLYWGQGTSLRSVRFKSKLPHGEPVRTGTVVSSPAKDGNNWLSPEALFVAQD